MDQDSPVLTRAHRPVRRSGRGMPTFHRSRVVGGPLRAPNGGSSQPSMGTGTASTKGSPAGPTGVSGNCCSSISPTTRIWNTSSSTARWSGPTPAPQERPPKGWLSSPGPGPEPRRVQHQGSRQRRCLRQSPAIHPDWGSKARHYPGPGSDSRLCRGVRNCRQGV